MEDRSGLDSASTRVDLALSPEATWRRLSDLTLAHRYVPGIIRTTMTTAETRGVGASRKVYRSESDAMDETVVEWQEGRGLVLRLHYGDGGPPLPFERAWFRYWIEGGDDRHTELTLSLDYAMRWGVFGKVLGACGVGWLIRRQVAEIGTRLKAFYENTDRE